MLSLARLTLATVALSSIASFSVDAASVKCTAANANVNGLCSHITDVAPINAASNPPYQTVSACGQTPNDQNAQNTGCVIGELNFVVSIQAIAAGSASPSPVSCYEDSSISESQSKCWSNGILFTPSDSASVAFNDVGVEIVGSTFSSSSDPSPSNINDGYLQISTSGQVSLTLAAGASISVFDGAELAIDSSNGAVFLGLGYEVNPLDPPQNKPLYPATQAGFSFDPSTGTCSYGGAVVQRTWLCWVGQDKGCSSNNVGSSPPTLDLDSTNPGTVQINVQAGSFDPSSLGCTITYNYQTSVDTYTPCPDPHSQAYAELPCNSPCRTASTCGDPQFNGFVGQSFQVHGVAGTVYNVISTPDVQLNALFSYLESGRCRVGTTCFGHPGNYFGEIGMLLKDGKSVNMVHVVAGPVDVGMTVQVNGELLPISDLPTVVGGVSLRRVDSFDLEVQTPEFSVRIQNSDMFLNEEVSINPKLMDAIAAHKRAFKAGNATDDVTLPHGLLGQTWHRTVYPNRWKYIEGQLFDYSVADGIFGTEFKYNRF